MFCIDQFASIFQKVIKDYKIFTKGKMELTEISTIFKQLYKLSSSLFEYIKITNDDDKLKESDKIERIKK